ncbi:MAG: glycosyltransferase [Armatimonadetes bacterium]|nr:glycosyltransferase [Armatimonadota bacterium]
MRVFFLTEFLPRPDTSAGDRRLFALLEILASRHEVHLCVMRNEADLQGLPAWQNGDASERERLQKTAADLPRYRRDLENSNITLLPFGWKHIGAALATHRYDVGFFEYYWITDDYAPVFRKCQPGTPVICDSVDVCFARTERGAAFGQESATEAARIKERELRAFRASDAVITVSTDDDALLRSLPPMPPSFLVPIIVPVRPRATRTASRECVFVGGFKHYPNVDGVLWFAENVWQKIRAAVPDAVFTVVGSHPPPEIIALGDLPGVSVTGYVPDTNPYLDRCAVSVAPLRWGGGMKGKVSEAVACGVPVVTTAIGAQGFAAQNGVEMAITDDPEAFAEAVIALLQNPAKAEAMGLAGQAKLADLCSPEAVAAQTEAMLKAVVPAPVSAHFSPVWLAYRTAFFAARTVLGRGR